MAEERKDKENPVDVPTNPFENLQKTMLALQKLVEPLVEWQNRINEMMKPYTTLVTTIQKQLEPFNKIGETFAKYLEQLKQNFIDIISVIEPPETYDPSKVKLHDGIDKMILSMVVFADDMDKHAFCYLKERMLIGINAHFEGNYHLSLFCIFSAIDGMLSWFYVQNHKGMPIPDINQKLKEFFDAYTFEHIVGKKEIRPKFEDFFRHRNEIMHGGENSHFDKNLSTAALLFLGIVYSSLTAKE